MKRSDGGMAVGSALGATGTALAALLGMLCCAGPAVVAVLGTGGAVAAAGIEPYRPYLLGASAVMLGFGFWRAYRPAPAGAGAACSIRTGRVVRTILWVAALLTIASALAPRLFS
jgi:mercuric ion transport protein